MKKSFICPGFRFHPTDVELVMYYLKKKLLGKKLVPEVIAEVSIYEFSPWDLPDKSKLRSGDLEWFFFCAKSRKYSNGSRINRTTEVGYWKATGKDKEIKYKEKTVGMMKTLVFHLGHPPKGERTDWVMHEYRMEDKDLANNGVVQDAYVICRLFKKSGFGPKNGAQYGAPFEEEEWNDDVDEVSCYESLGGVVNLTEAKYSVSSTGSGSTLINMTSTEPGPSTRTSSENERYHVSNTPLQYNTQEEEDHKGKKVMIDAPSPKEGDDMFIALDNLITLDDLSQDGFNRFSNDRSAASYMQDSFPLDDLDIDLGEFFFG